QCRQSPIDVLQIKACCPYHGDDFSTALRRKYHQLNVAARGDLVADDVDIALRRRTIIHRRSWAPHTVMVPARLSKRRSRNRSYIWRETPPLNNSVHAAARRRRDCCADIQATTSSWCFPVVQDSVGNRKWRCAGPFDGGWTPTSDSLKLWTGVTD